jgi:hypothetical protein
MRPAGYPKRAVFRAELPQPGLPCRLEARPSFQPRRMHAVARAVGVARVDALEAEQEIALLSHPARRQRIGEFLR